MSAARGEPAPTPGAELAAALTAVLGPGRVDVSEAARHGAAADVWSEGPPVCAVARPANADDVTHIVELAGRAGIAIVPRGAGLSYTGGVVPDHTPAVALDTTALASIDVRADDAVVHVGAGATWAALHETLSRARLRTPFYGPLSGLHATVGGALSQNAAFFGSAAYGTAADSVLGLEVVLGDGQRLSTGARDAHGAFFRHDGPDLTGLFLGDCGAFGIKVAATLRLMPAPAHVHGGSFRFPERAAFLAALSAVGRSALCSEVFGSDPAVTRERLRSPSLRDDLGALAAVLRSHPRRWRGLQDAARVALAGRRALAGPAFLLNTVVEAQGAAEADERGAAVASIARAHGGLPTVPTVPQVTRARPFPRLNALLGAHGERWVPLHGILAHSAVLATDTRVRAVLDEATAPDRESRIEGGVIYAAIGTSAILVEPMMFWPGERLPVHRQYLSAERLARLPTHAHDARVHAQVRALRASLASLFTAAGAAHLQIGRYYPFLPTRAPRQRALLQALKAQLDPTAIINPGVLGLPARHAPGDVH